MTMRTVHIRVGVLLASLMLFILTACVPELPVEMRNSGSLNLLPQIQGAVQTKTVGDKVDGIANEKALFTLDVFIKGRGTNNSDFWKHYHLPLTANGANPTPEVRNLLSSRWKEDGLVEGDSYAVYVVANHSFGTTFPSNLTALAGEREDEYSDACLWSDGTLDPSKMTLHKTYMESSEYQALELRNKERIYTPSKQYMMDGFVPEWSPSGSGDQEIEVNLERAASKFEITIQFDPDFLAANPLYPGGQPGWRFLNFAFDAPVLDPANLGQETSDSQRMLSSGALLLGNASFVTTSEGTSTSIVTYSYPRKWNSAEAVEKAPALVVSIPYKKGDNEVTYNYYRIPIVNQATTAEIGRNKIYRVTATISSTGATSLEDLTESIVDYQVIPWNDAAHSGSQPADIVSTERMFLQVTPHTYILRGNGSQSVDLTYYLPSGEHVGIQYFGQADNEKIAAGTPVGNTGSTYSSGRPAAWYYNNKDAYRTSFLNSNVQVSINDNNAQGDVAKGTITVSSNSLANKAIKHIAFRVYLDVDDWYNKGLYRDIYIRHFPTDNIQTIAGSWSSRWDGQYEGGTPTGETYTGYSAPAGWNSFTVTEGTEQTVSYEVFRAAPGTKRHNGAPINNLQNQDKATIFGITAGNNNNQTNQRCYGTGHNSIEKAILYNGYYYWVTRTGSNNNYTYTYYRANTFYATPYFYTRTIGGIPNTGTWVDWDTDEGKTLDPHKYTYDGHFYAKKYIAPNNMYPMDVSSSWKYTRSTSQNNWHSYSSTNNQRVSSPSSNYSNGFNGTFTNNHMYVVQITKTSNDYVMGRPELDANSQSQDHVVSPAFMIASQLGGISDQFNQNAGTAPALHCASYMEVGEDGTRYVGWRLPTRDEISVIVKYQGTTTFVEIDGVRITNTDDRILLPVLTAQYYFTLDGGTVDLGSGGFYAVRCIRDMSAAEIKALNKD